MSNRAIRRAAERAALKAAVKQEKTMSAAAGASPESSPNVDFAGSEEEQTAPPRRPLSDAQMAANKANAQKSHGAVTPEGRLKSSLNAVKTGLTGQTVLLPTDDAIAYQAHLDRHFTRYSPATDEEHTLVQMIADTEFRILRIPGLEASICAIGRLKLADLHPEEADPSAREALIRGEVFLAYRRDLTNLALQERRLRNQHKSDLAKLEALQNERKEQERKNTKGAIQESMLKAFRIMDHYQQQRKKFVPEPHGFVFSMAEIEHCHQAFLDAQTNDQPEPCFAELLLSFRKTQKEAQAA